LFRKSSRTIQLLFLTYSIFHHCAIPVTSTVGYVEYARKKGNTIHRARLAGKSYSDLSGGIAMVKAPELANSTAEERRDFIKKKYPCIADCDLCGLCKVFRGRDAEHAFEDYILGKRSFIDVSADYKR